MRYRITAPERGYTGVSAGIQFIEGIAEVTENCSLDRLSWFVRKGYTVEELTETADEKQDSELGGQLKALKKMKTEELLAYATERNIDLSDCSTNDLKREKIGMFLTQLAQEAQERAEKE